MSEPLTRTILESEYLRLKSIEESASQLADAVTRRMSAEVPTDAVVLELFQAHRKLTTTLAN